jgi:transcriptional regulator with XRE-family HTH domain
MAKTTNSIDKHIGMRVRRTRLFRDMTQMQLAAALGVSLHQVKKYEGGFERIGASELLEICRVFEVRPSFFFSEMKFNGPATEPVVNSSERIQEFVALVEAAAPAMADAGALSAKLAAIAEQARLRNSPVTTILSKIEAEFATRQPGANEMAHIPPKPGTAGRPAPQI